MNKKMRPFIIPILLLMTTFLISPEKSYAQPGEKIKQLRIAFLTEKLDLSVEEGQQFWPLFNEFENEKHELERSIRKDYRFIKDAGAEITSSQLLNRMEKITNSKKQIVDLEGEFIKQCETVIGPGKSALLMAAEDEFKREVLKRLRDKGRRP